MLANVASAQFEKKKKMMISLSLLLSAVVNDAPSNYSCGNSDIEAHHDFCFACGVNLRHQRPSLQAQQGFSGQQHSGFYGTTQSPLQQQQQISTSSHRQHQDASRDQRDANQGSGASGRQNSGPAVMRSEQQRGNTAPYGGSAGEAGGPQQGHARQLSRGAVDMLSALPNAPLSLPPASSIGLPASASQANNDVVSVLGKSLH